MLLDLVGPEVDLARGLLPDARVAGQDTDVMALSVTDSKVEELAAIAERAGALMTGPAKLAKHAPCPADSGPVAEACARLFVRGFTTRAWGRPPTDGESASLLEIYRVGAEGGGFARGVALLVEAVLQSPHFFYRSELGRQPRQVPGTSRSGTARLDGAETASQISFLLTGARPDAELLLAGLSGLLDTGERRAREARRLLATERARQHLREFLIAWLGLGDVAMLNKNLALYPGFTGPVRQALARELDLTLAELLGRPAGARLDDLLLLDHSFPGGASAIIYGDELGAPPGEHRRMEWPAHRRGLLSSPAFLAAHGGVEHPSPVKRGLMVRARLLCQDVPPPPADAQATMPSESALPESIRRRYQQHAADPRCAGCHRLMDPIGFGFERFDALGGHSVMEGKTPVDGRGELTGTDVDGPFLGPAELGRRLLGSRQFQRCFVEQAWRYAEGRPPAAGDNGEIEWLDEQLQRSGKRIDELFVALVSRPRFVLRQVTEEAP